MNERNRIILKLILSHIILPVVLICIPLAIINVSYLLLSIVQTVFCILFFSGYWEFFGFKFKKLYLLSLEIVLLILFAQKEFTAINVHFDILLLSLLSIIQAYLIIIFIKIIIVIYKNDKEKLEIVFPLRNGKYLVTDGGNSKISRLMNYHFYSYIHRKKKTNHSMLYATDIVKIDADRKRFLPKHNEEYPIFGENVYCPMEGLVVKIENGINDNEPFAGKYPYNTGNTVVIRNGNYYFLLGHLKKGSIELAERETVKQNDLIGKIGNSGFSERPHLHMQLIESESEDFWHGKGICIQYQGKNLYKNRVIIMD